MIDVKQAVLEEIATIENEQDLRIIYFFLRGLEAINSKKNKIS